jgi:hypothetical protein
VSGGPDAELAGEACHRLPNSSCITKLEMKKAWQEGRKDLFYPYAQTLGEQD